MTRLRPGPVSGTLLELRRDGGWLRRGLTLIEVSIAIAVSAVIFSAVYSALNTSVGGDRALRVRVDMQLDAARIMREITEILKNSGPIDANGDGVFDPGDYPYLWNDGTTNTAPFGGFYAFVDRGNPGIVQQATTALDGLGATQEIAFRQPRDVGGDGRPIRALDGAIEWGTDTFALVLVPGPNGNELQFRRYDAAMTLVDSRVVGRYIERITFETALTEPQPVLAPRVPLGANQFRVTAWFRRVADRKTFTLRQMSTVTCAASAIDLRNP